MAKPAEVAPKGYVDWHDWAERKVKLGAKQEQCPVCKLWHFKCEKHQCSPNKPTGSDKP